MEKLVERVQSSTLLDDRRDACRALKALSRPYRIEVGAQGMTALKQILDEDRTDCEIVGLALDTLCNVTSPETFEQEGMVLTDTYMVKMSLKLIESIFSSECLYFSRKI